MKPMIGAALALSFLAMTLFFSCMALADLNGGGGIKRDGQFLTFSAAKVPLTRAEVRDIPGMSIVLNTVLKLDLNAKTGEQLYESLAPSTDRRYYIVDSISPEETERLEDIYRAIVKAKPGDDSELYAVTDTTNEETYLLPDFFKLTSDDERSKILFHEGMWVLDPCSGNHLYEFGLPGYCSEYSPDRLTYEQVVATENAYADFLQETEASDDSFPLDLVENISKVLHDPVILFFDGVNYDIRKKNLEVQPVTLQFDYGILQPENTPLNFKGIAMDQLFANDAPQVTAARLAGQNPKVALYAAVARAPLSMAYGLYHNWDYETGPHQNQPFKHYYLVVDPATNQLLDIQFKPNVIGTDQEAGSTKESP